MVLTLIAALCLGLTGLRAGPSDKIDPLLSSVCNRNEGGSVRIIVEFYDTPTSQDIEELEERGFTTLRVFKIIKAVAGVADCNSIAAIADLEHVKRVWLDRKAHALQGGEDETDQRYPNRSDAYTKHPPDESSSDSAKDQSSTSSFHTALSNVHIFIAILILIAISAALVFLRHGLRR